MAIYVLGTWSENEYCVVVQLGIVDDDYNGRLCRRWDRLLCYLTSAFSSLLPPHRKLRPSATERLAGGRREEHKGRPDVHPLG